MRRPKTCAFKDYSPSPKLCARGRPILDAVCAADKGAEGGEVALVVSGFVERRFEDEGGLREFWMPCDACEGFRADVSEADVPVAIHARVVVGLRIVEVDGADVLCADVSFERVEGRAGSVFVAEVVPGGEGVRGVEADAERERGTGGDNVSEVLEAVADARSLPR